MTTTCYNNNCKLITDVYFMDNKFIHFLNIVCTELRTFSAGINDFKIHDNKGISNTFIGVEAFIYLYKSSRKYKSILGE